MTDDSRLEERLRDDPTNDPVHVTGMFRDRMIDRVSIRPVAGHSIRRARPAFVLAVVIVGIALVGRFGINPRLDGGASQSLVPSGPSSEEPTPSLTTDRLRAAVAAWAADHGGPGVAVTVVDGRGDILQATSAALSPDAAVRIAEVSRVFIARAVFALDECRRGEGYVCPPGVTTFRIDDPVARWSPGWPAGDPTTIRQLLEGSSGLAAVASSIPVLDTTIAADPSADWSRETVIEAAMNAPRRFPPGTRRDPVDTEFMVLEDVVDRASASYPRSYIADVSSHGHGEVGRIVGGAAPVNLVPGISASGGKRSDLDPKVIDIVRDEGAVVSTSRGLALLAVDTWASSIAHAPATIDELSDRLHGHAGPIAATASCPCSGTDRTLVAASGHAGAWSSLSAYAFGPHTAIGVILDHDVDQADLDGLLQRLLALATGRPG